jgi:hypothetical protein
MLLKNLENEALKSRQKGLLKFRTSGGMSAFHFGHSHAILA